MILGNGTENLWHPKTADMGKLYCKSKLIKWSISYIKSVLSAAMLVLNFCQLKIIILGTVESVLCEVMKNDERRLGKETHKKRWIIYVFYDVTHDTFSLSHNFVVKGLVVCQ